jgi:hypothetical protein
MLWNSLHDHVYSVHVRLRDPHISAHVHLNQKVKKTHDFSHFGNTGDSSNVQGVNANQGVWEDKENWASLIDIPIQVCDGPGYGCLWRTA